MMRAPMKDRSGELDFEQMMKRIDVYGRLAYGGQCVAAMAMLAGPALFVTASIVPFFVDDTREAVAIWLLGWLTGAGVAVGGVLFGVFCWRWSGDWITEWPGYAVAFGIAAAMCVAQAYLLMSTPVPVYLSFIITTSVAFVAGFLIAGNLAGTQVLPETRQMRPGAAVRRR